MFLWNMLRRNKDMMIYFVIISYQTTGMCPNGWELFRRWCYYVDEKKLDYWQARSACKDMGGILTSVLDEEEQIFINGKSELRTWFHCSESEEIFHSLSLKAIFLYNNLLLYTEVCYFLKYIFNCVIVIRVPLYCTWRNLLTVLITIKEICKGKK